MTGCISATSTNTEVIDLSTFKTYLETLQAQLIPSYTPPATPGGYDVNHVLEMAALGPSIKALPRYKTLDMEEFVTAVWLHNSDRPDSMVNFLHNKDYPRGDDGWKNDNWKPYLQKLLADSPFDDEARNRIIDAVLEHSKKDDEEGDSVLLTALRIADKVVRFGPLGMMGQPANRGRTQMFYDPEEPFVYGSTAEDKLRAVWNDYFRVLEWLTMLLKRALTEDELWSLVDKADIADEVHYIRGVGRQIARVTGGENKVEECVQKALGDLYKQFPPMQLVPA
ncbi:MAG TPA: hypothetical protein VHD55_03915 [Candidatus Paceibacterota bacterium]|nr:hypothetical protein [Candidatus Paceibacterota bacterium]